MRTGTLFPNANLDRSTRRNANLPARQYICDVQLLGLRQFVDLR
jgi:hypothetical protein